MGVLQPKTMHGFSTNFSDMFSPRGSRGYLATTVAMSTLLKMFGSSSLWVFDINPCMDFHQIFRICLHQEDLELFRYQWYLITAVAIVML